MYEKKGLDTDSIDHRRPAPDPPRVFHFRKKNRIPA
jgi:hypothetical protein